MFLCYFDPYRVLGALIIVAVLLLVLTLMKEEGNLYLILFNLKNIHKAVYVQFVLLKKNPIVETCAYMYYLEGDFEKRPLNSVKMCRFVNRMYEPKASTLYS